MKHDENLRRAMELLRKARITDELSTGSEKKYLSSLRAFLERCELSRWEALSNDDLEGFILCMKESGAGNARIANIIAAVKWLVSRLREQGVRFRALRLDAIKKPRIVKKETNYLTEQEMGKFLGCVQEDIRKRPTVKSIRFMALVILLLQTGARIGEALSIDRTKIDRDAREIRIIGKGAKPRSLFLRSETLRWLDRYLGLRSDAHQALFVTQAGTSRWKQTDVGRVFRRYRERSGISKEFVVHTLRHTFATQYLLRGAGINVVQTAMGHSDPVTTLKYYAATVEKAKVRAMINDTRYDFLPEALIGTVHSS
jgi:site-specific recombinase XerD